MIKENKKLIAYGYIFIGAILFVIGIQMFLQQAMTFSVGIGSLAALPTFIVDESNFDFRPFISLLYLALNMPLIIYYWNKNSKRFTYRTIYFLILQAILGSIFLIPEIKDWLDNPINLELKKGETIRDQQWVIIVYSMIGSLLTGIGIGIAWKFGGSSGGSDIITYYWTSKRKMSIGKGMLVMAILFLLISFSITVATNESIRKYWLITLMSSFVYLIININLVNIIFPKYKKVSLHIVSEKHKSISAYLKKTGYIHSWKIIDFESGYNQNKRQELTTTLFLLESNSFIKGLKKIDPNIWIQVVPVIKVHGHINSKNVDNH